MKSSIAVKLRNKVRDIFIKIRYLWLKKIFKINIAETAKISLFAKLDQTNPQGIFIGRYSYVASGTCIMSHDYAKGRYLETRIGEYCFIGYGAIIMPGVVIGDHSIVGAGAVVTKDVEPNSIVAGNPARTIQKDIDTDAFGRLKQ